MTMRLFLVQGACWLMLAAGTGLAADGPLSGERQRDLVAVHRARLESLTAALEARPADTALLSRRGDARLFLGDFTGAVADFRRSIELDPSLDLPHWRLGIALYFAGELRAAARQFEKYHRHDGRDRENGIWKFLCEAELSGVETARERMLLYREFDREPFPLLYRMFAGEISTAEFLEEFSRQGQPADGAQAFFAHYYAGLNEQLLGRRGEAMRLLERAVGSPWGAGAAEPPYMWQVARLHWERVRAHQAALEPE